MNDHDNDIQKEDILCHSIGSRNAYMQLKGGWLDDQLTGPDVATGAGN